ncbi:MAG: YncE family protein [Gemmatimonadota bacterium]
MATPKMPRPVAWALLIGAISTTMVGAALINRAPEVDRQTKVHAGLYEVYAHDGSVWVTAVGSSLVPGSKLVQLDGESLEEIGSIDMGDAAGFGIAINRRTGMAYTSNTRVGTMGVINLNTGDVTHVTNPDADGEPHLFRVVVDEANNMVYSTIAQSPGQVWVVDGATSTLDRVIETGGERPTGLIHDAERNRLYVSNMGDDFISVIDLSSDRVIDKIPTVGTRSTQLAFDAAGDRLFVGNQTSNGISVIDLNEMRAVRRVGVGEQPVGVAYHPIANQIFVANRRSSTVSVIDGETYEVVGELEIGTFPNAIHVDERTGNVYVTNKAARTPRGEEPRIDPQGDMVTLIKP